MSRVLNFEKELSGLLGSDKRLESMLNENMDKLVNGHIPQNYIDMEHNWDFTSFGRRQEFIEIQGYALISKDWVGCLVPLLQNSRCLEIMAGKGALTYALKEQGIDIIATDDMSWEDYNSGQQSWGDVEKLEATKAIEKYAPDFVIMSWCPYESNDGYKALLKMREVNPKAHMIVIGEGASGCTADNDFFEAISVIPNEYITLANLRFASWMGIHDRVMLVK